MLQLVTKRKPNAVSNTTNVRNKKEAYDPYSLSQLDKRKKL